MNLNDYVYVKLTAEGQRVWDDFFIALGLSPVEHQKHHLVDGRVRFQLWNLMQIFSGMCYMGCPDVPFVGNEIELV